MDGEKSKFKVKVKAENMGLDIKGIFNMDVISEPYLKKHLPTAIYSHLCVMLLKIMTCSSQKVEQPLLA